MSLLQPNSPAPVCPPTVDDLRRLLHDRLDLVIDACLANHLQSSFLTFEKALLPHLSALGLLLIRLFLLLRHQRLDLAAAGQQGRYRVADDYASRTLKTTCGEISYGRAYLIPRKGGGPGFHPLDAQLGLTRDCFSPLVVSLFCRLCTRLSFRLSVDLGSMFLGWAPAQSTVEEWALGLGRPAHAYLSTGPLPEGDGEVLVIECDGKAIPTATDEELAKRRGRRQRGCGCDGRGCKCQRHRGRSGRKSRGKRKKRKPGDRSKNGRSAVLIAMYTLKRGEDGRLHGPINKKVYGTFSSRREALKWARQQATRRGFGPDTTKTVQIILDGEICLEQQMRRLFPNAILTLDIRHAQERLWKVGRLLHPEGSQELADWVEPLQQLLYQGRLQELLSRLGEMNFVGPGSKHKRKVQTKAVAYLQKREGLMKYQEWREQDLVLASGVVEGAARYVIGERLDNSGMRWIAQRAEAVLLLRCIEVNGDWEEFFAFSEEQRQAELNQGKAVQIRSHVPIQLPQGGERAEKERRRRKKRRRREPLQRFQPICTQRQAAARPPHGHHALDEMPYLPAERIGLLVVSRSACAIRSPHPAAAQCDRISPVSLSGAPSVSGVSGTENVCQLSFTPGRQDSLIQMRPPATFHFPTNSTPCQRQ